MSSFDHTILITSAGGNLCSELVPQLLQQQRVKPVLPTSNASRLRSSLPSKANEENVIVEEGSIKDPKWLGNLITAHAVNTVFLNLTGSDELFTSCNFVAVCQRVGGIQHLV